MRKTAQVRGRLARERLQQELQKEISAAMSRAAERIKLAAVARPPGGSVQMRSSALDRSAVNTTLGIPSCPK